MRYMNFDDLCEQQSHVIYESRSTMPVIGKCVGIGTSALMALLYETGKIADINTQSGIVQSYAWLWIYKSVYTIAASLTCAESGFYAESIALNRSISEALVQILYLLRYPADVDKLPSIDNGKKRKLKFASMFEEIAPGYYTTSYNFSSEFSHPGLASNVYKIQRDASGSGSIDQGIIFKVDPLTHCFNELCMLILGLLRSIALVYPSAVLKSTTEVQWNVAVRYLQSVIDSHIELKGGENEWHRLSKPLWSPK